MANNNKMDNGKLLKIGFEAFKMLEDQEDQYGTKPAAYTQACQYKYQPPQTRVFQVKNPPVSSTEEKINCYEAMRFHGGLMIMDYSKTKSAAIAS
ncbi:hypothetical protein ACH5RR_031076 [Cinchona calisaya]|uniref:Uncharacterized protein n=1 Tax=Cinchona calisaya TaxID=153742 RepID=A0ABD2YE56_9GENT